MLNFQQISKIVTTNKDDYIKKNEHGQKSTHIYIYIYIYIHVYIERERDL